jgi:hypothetical protein
MAAPLAPGLLALSSAHLPQTSHAELIVPAMAASPLCSLLPGRRSRPQQTGKSGGKPAGDALRGRGAARGVTRGVTSAGGTRDAAGALDAGWTVWMRQNRAPRLAVNVYNRYLISSRDYIN